MRGSFKKKTAKVASINVVKQIIYLEGIQRTKRDGTKTNVPFSSSSLQIQILNSEDKKRLKSVKQNSENKGEKKNAPNKS